MTLVRRSPRAAVALTLAASIGACLVSAPSLGSEPESSPAPEPMSALDELADRGAHCVECYLLWDPVASREFVKEWSARSDVAEAHPWLDIELSDTDGTRFALADLSGRPVLVEVMATWCPSCAAQQDVLRDARAELPADAVLVSLDVDPFGRPDALARYAASRGYAWRFAVAPVELSRGLAESFGDAVINPAVSPIVVIDRDGQASLAPLGHKDLAAILALLDPAS